MTPASPSFSSASTVLLHFLKQYRMCRGTGGEERNFCALIILQIERKDRSSCKIGEDRAGFQENCRGGGDVPELSIYRHRAVRDAGGNLNRFQRRGSQHA